MRDLLFFGTVLDNEVLVEDSNTNKLNCILENKISSDISENYIREKMPEILDILLIDHSTSTKNVINNIIWANYNYIKYGTRLYSPTSQIKPSLITGNFSSLIMPRALKSSEIRKERTKTKAEVFTPLWVVKLQNDAVDEKYNNDDLLTYTSRKWLEITCGEAPYMASRYNMETGEIIALDQREGFLDRKLKRISLEVNDHDEWNRLAIIAFKSCYGFEWSGDSLLIARENLLYTYYDYYLAKWNKPPSYKDFKLIAEIISYNVFQMDGIKGIVPLSDTEHYSKFTQYGLFPNNYTNKYKSVGKKAKIMNWQTEKMEVFKVNKS